MDKRTKGDDDRNPANQPLREDYAYAQSLQVCFAGKLALIEYLPAAGQARLRVWGAGAEPVFVP